MLVEAGGVDLRELVLEQVELALARGGELAQGVQLRGEAPGLGERLRAGAQAQRVIGTAERVEDLQLGAGEGQLAVLVLAVEGDQARAELAQLRDGGGAAVEIGARAPVGADAAGEDDLLGAVGEPLGELGGQRVGQVEDALDIGLGSAGAD